jgi:TonB family protein
MQLRTAATLVGSLLLIVAVLGQQPPASPAPSPAQTKPDECPFPPESKIAQFDTSLYLPLGSGVKVGRAVSTPDPEYSEIARQKKITGCVLLALAISATGTVDAVKVIKPLGAGLDQKAVEAVQQWKFAPATKDGQPVAVQIPVSVGFRLY